MLATALPPFLDPLAIRTLSRHQHRASQKFPLPQPVHYENEISYNILTAGDLNYATYEIYTEEQIIGMLKEHEAGISMVDLSRQHNVSTQGLTPNLTDGSRSMVV